MPAAVAGDESAGELLLRAAAMVPLAHYAIAALVVASVIMYRFLELHVIGDLLRGFRGGRVELTFHPASEIYHCVVSKCRSLHGRYGCGFYVVLIAHEWYLATPWLASPHLQTLFLGISGRPPSFTYKRHLYTLRDGGTVALDWLLASDLELEDADGFISKDSLIPLAFVVPGLTSDSSAAYVKHVVYSMASKGWNVVVSNHRGLGGVSITVKYLGEEGESTPVAGAVSICSPWDLLIGDRFISRKLVQRLYDKALAIGLKGYAKLHQPVMARLANWESIKKTVDTYYRRCSSASYVGNVSVPLLCISALDDPLCTREAIPWDECRANKNIVLATTPKWWSSCILSRTNCQKTMVWWVGATSEFLCALLDSSYTHRQKAQDHVLHSSLESSIDKSPYVNIMEDGMIAPVTNDGTRNDSSPSNQTVDEVKLGDKLDFILETQFVI
ncbi:hypothetical protein PR202_ga08904 [Eleusine coracana subsp. coracana]|uniref:Embryogenesis-associated protein EMB8 n=1 Tax=Eleusine coracana subsp. coracana TaxID=191504 RepID=A0AAV5C1G8_ELECO|nr:hypothetical protein PR202_ga08904 [Eleusine coracana subsp. coracana]